MSKSKSKKGLATTTTTPAANTVKLVTEVQSASIPISDEQVPESVKQSSLHPSQSDESKSTTVAGACTDVVNRRLRTLKKRLAKIEKSEKTPVSELNKDQLEALQKKGEVVSTINELEEILKNFNVIEVDVGVLTIIRNKD
jgi:hypothetical protein